jgi:hypothetical protein
MCSDWADISTLQEELEDAFCYENNDSINSRVAIGLRWGDCNILTYPPYFYTQTDPVRKTSVYRIDHYSYGNSVSTNITVLVLHRVVPVQY